MANDLGILGFGAYLPRARLQRKAILAANAWFNPGLRGLAKGERAMANWDEDSITLAVEAGRDCLAGDPATPAALVLASTTLPFDDRLNAGVVASALGLPSAVRSSDAAGSLRAGASALTGALAGADALGATLVLAADHRRTRAASPQEMQYGDGAAALLVGRGRPLARLVGSHTETVDFVHQFRYHDRDSDYAWEERWIRDEGYLKIVPRAIGALLAATGTDAATITHFCMPCTLSRVGGAVAKKVGIPEAAVRDTLSAVCGDTGAAHPLVMLVHALQQAQPGDRILVAAFGEGCDALLFEVTDAIGQASPRRGVTGSLAARREESNYLKFLSFNEVIDMERGMRAEVDKGTPLSVLYRNREMVQGLSGGRCRACGTMQYPKGRYCVNPGCKALDSQDDQRFADLTGTVMSYTADQLTYSADPPAYYGMLNFDQGGRMLADFTEIEDGKLDVGTPMRMVFRIKDVDSTRGFVRYFWKAAPIGA
jgi:3-hydroxy-3-methylglutaryl CoA synthase